MFYLLLIASAEGQNATTNTPAANANTTDATAATAAADVTTDATNSTNSNTTATNTAAISHAGIMYMSSVFMCYLGTVIYKFFAV